MFEQSPALCLLLDTRFFIVAATDAYLAATMTVREHIVGRSLFDVFPDNPDGKASGRHIEGSTKGPAAVNDDLVPRLKELLADAKVK